MKTIAYLIIWIIAVVISIPLTPIVFAWDLAVVNCTKIDEYLKK